MRATEITSIGATRWKMSGNRHDNMRIRPQRKIGPTRRSLSGIYMFRRESSIAYESSLERDFLIRKEFFLNVLEIIPQPVQIPFTGTNGRSYTYTPDFLVMYRLGNREYPGYPKPALVEVKERKEWRKHWRRWSAKWKAAMRCAKEQGWTFHVHDESRIRDQALENIRFLERYKRMRFAEHDSERVIEILADIGSVPLDNLLTLHFEGSARAEGIAHLWHLLAVRRLECDISRALSNLTELWVPTDE